MTVAHSVHYLLQSCLKMPMPVINCTVNSALVSATTVFSYKPHNFSDLYFTFCKTALDFKYGICHSNAGIQTVKAFW